MRSPTPSSKICHNMLRDATNGFRRTGLTAVGDTVHEGGTNNPMQLPCSARKNRPQEDVTSSYKALRPPERTHAKIHKPGPHVEDSSLLGACYKARPSIPPRPHPTLRSDQHRGVLGLVVRSIAGFGSESGGRTATIFGLFEGSSGRSWAMHDADNQYVDVGRLWNAQSPSSKATSSSSP